MQTDTYETVYLQVATCVGQVHQVGQEQVQTNPYYTVYLQVATCVGQVLQVGQEQVQTDLLLHCLPSGGDLCGAGALGVPWIGADGSLLHCLPAAGGNLCGQVHQVGQEQVQTDPYYTVYL